MNIENLRRMGRGRPRFHVIGPYVEGEGADADRQSQGVGGGKQQGSL